jgi:hypothetical protein
MGGVKLPIKTTWRWPTPSNTPGPSISIYRRNEAGAGLSIPKQARPHLPGHFPKTPPIPLLFLRSVPLRIRRKKDTHENTPTYTATMNSQQRHPTPSTPTHATQPHTPTLKRSTRFYRHRCQRAPHPQQRGAAEEHWLQSMLADYEAQEAGYMQHVQEQAAAERRLQVTRRKLQQRERIATPTKARTTKAEIVSTALRTLRETEAKRDDLKLRLDDEVKRRVLLGERLVRERERWAVAKEEMEDLLSREREKTRVAMEQVGMLGKAIMVLARTKEMGGEGL